MYMCWDLYGCYNNFGDVWVVINCVDQFLVIDCDKVIDEDCCVWEIVLFMSYGKFIGDVLLGICVFWLVLFISQFYVVLVFGLVLMVVVFIIYDLVMLYKVGVDLVNQFCGLLLIFDGIQYMVVFQGDSCIDEYVMVYLIGGIMLFSGVKCQWGEEMKV